MEFRFEQLVSGSPPVWEFVDLVRAASPEAALGSIAATKSLSPDRYRCTAADGTVTELVLDSGDIGSRPS